MTLLTLTRWSSEMLTYLAALFLLAAAPLAAQEKNVEDYLPLAVGNSWTYLHWFVDDRRNTDGSYLNPSEQGIQKSQSLSSARRSSKGISTMSSPTQPPTFLWRSPTTS